MPRGPITKTMQTLLNKYGYDISRDKMEDCSNGSSGHANLRYGINILIADCMNRMMDTIFSTPLD